MENYRKKEIIEKKYIEKIVKKECFLCLFTCRRCFLCQTDLNADDTSAVFKFYGKVSVYLIMLMQAQKQKSYDKNINYCLRQKTVLNF